METVQPESNLQDAGAQAPAVPAHPLEKKHDDRDILEGCPRSILINGKEVKKRAYKNNEYSLIAFIITHLGFMTCEAEEEVASIPVEEIFTNCAANLPLIAERIKYNSLEDLLYDQMDLSDTPEFLFDDITHEEFVAFFGMLIEQNCLIKAAKATAKKKLQAQKNGMSLF